MTRFRREEGLSLAELLVAMAILGLAVVTVLSGYTTSLLTASRHEASTRADVVARQVAESVKAQAYDPCPASYAAGAPDVPYPQGWGPGDVSIAITYWDRSSDSFEAGCPGGGDDGLQKVSIGVSSPTNRGDRSPLEILKRAD